MRSCRTPSLKVSCWNFHCRHAVKHQYSAFWRFQKKCSEIVDTTGCFWFGYWCRSWPLPANLICFRIYWIPCDSSISKRETNYFCKVSNSHLLLKASAIAFQLEMIVLKFDTFSQKCKVTQFKNYFYQTLQALDGEFSFRWIFQSIFWKLGFKTHVLHFV